VRASFLRRSRQLERCFTIQSSKAFSKPITECTYTVTDKKGRTITKHAQPVSPATANRDMALLSAMFTTALKQDIITKIPVDFEYDEEDTTARDGFVEQWQYDQLQAACEERWVKGFLSVNYNWGFRHQETLGLKVHQFDPLRDRLNLKPIDTKGKKPRYAILTGTDTLDYIRELCEGKDGDEYIFTRGKGRNANGKILKGRADRLKQGHGGN